ncbi:MAG: hypothetical protein AAF806_21450 [Bacteroidota bacterium]
MKHIYFLLSLLFSQAVLIAQVTNVTAKLNKAEDQFIVAYDLEEGEQDYWDIKLVAFIDGIRIEPSRASLSGDVGWQVKSGKKRRIFWDAFVDVEDINGIVRFEVWANESPFPPPPKATRDFWVGSSSNVLGLGIAATALPTFLQQNKVDINATPEEQPLLYYQTFCDPQSVHFDPNQVIPEQEGQSSACDQHFLTAEQKYQSAVLRTQIAGGLVLLGSAILLVKPINKYIEMPKYLKEYGLSMSMRPVLQLDNRQYLTSAPIGMEWMITYQF